MSKNTRHEAFQTNGELIKEWCEQQGMKYEYLNNGYQIRIEDVIDVYPVRLKWHWLSTGERGQLNYLEELATVMLQRIPETKVVEVVDEVAFIPPEQLEKVELPPQEDGKIEYHSNAPDDEQFIFPRGDGFKTIGTQPQEFNILREPEYPKVRTVQVGHRLIITDGEHALRYVDLTTNTVYEYPGTGYTLDMWYKKPKWWQWRQRRKYRRVLETTEEGADNGEAED